MMVVVVAWMRMRMRMRMDAFFFRFSARSNGSPTPNCQVELSFQHSLFTDRIYQRHLVDVGPWGQLSLGALSGIRYIEARLVGSKSNLTRGWQLAWNQDATAVGTSGDGAVIHAAEGEAITVPVRMAGVAAGDGMTSARQNKKGRATLVEKVGGSVCVQEGMAMVATKHYFCALVLLLSPLPLFFPCRSTATLLATCPPSSASSNRPARAGRCRFCTSQLSTRELITSAPMTRNTLRRSVWCPASPGS